MALKDSGKEFLRDILALVLARKGVFGTVAGAILGGSGIGLYQNADVSFNVHERTAVSAKFGEVTPQMYCAELQKSAGALNEYFSEQAKDSKKKNPEFAITPEDCAALIKPQTPAP